MSDLSNNPPKPQPCSPAMARVLLNLYRGLPMWGHLYGRSMHGGSGQTERAMRKRGWIDLHNNLTDAGRELAASLEESA